ncbi:MAG: helix-turn-helix transcriptional regulator [Ruminococcaceae bacterium]|nr:helix-turn-helix transcriptional regulator [Oscillospiraceae bacterium]
MDLKKFGNFFKELRKEKGLTQEELAEILFVSRRTVSRWETGSNLPDLVLLTELADFYQVDLRELINSERRSEKMDKDLKETVLRVADYSNEERSIFTKRLHILNILSFLCFTVHFIIRIAGLHNVEPYDFIGGFGSGTAYGMLMVNIIYTSKFGLKLRKFKQSLLKKKTT